LGLPRLLPSAIIGLAGGCILLSACTQKMICPAYQSAFIYDQDALRKQMSYFKEDSTPKVITVSRNRYLIIPEASYRKKIRSMQTIPMKPVYTKVPDSLRSDKKNEFAGAEQDTADTLSAKKKETKDSTYAITKDKEVRFWKYDWDSLKYRIDNVRLNADQDNYMWYNRDVLVLPDVRAAMEDQKNAKTAKANAGKEKKGGFFKNLFKKKPKKKEPPVETANVAPADSTGATPADSTGAPVAAPVKKKKGLFGIFKKKNQTNSKTSKPKDPAKKEEDGF
jgi:hypothetical protein